MTADTQAISLARGFLCNMEEPWNCKNCLLVSQLTEAEHKQQCHVGKSDKCRVIHLCLQSGS